MHRKNCCAWRSVIISGNCKGAVMLARFLLWTFMLAMATATQAEQAAVFDHRHILWDQLLQKHVYWIDNGVASQVDYEGFRREQATLDIYLDNLSSVTEDEFTRWPEKRQLGFLINAYNAFTVRLILNHWPVDSIRDIGGWLNNAWQMEFFNLLGAPHHLDWIEHEVIREPGGFNEPRIHFAVNCAAVGCPALRPEAYVGDRLDDQLEDQTIRFLSDASRNRYRNGRLELSSIFKWYREDFQRGWQGIDSLVEFMVPYADNLGAPSLSGKDNVQGRIEVKFLDYDWTLNRKTRTTGSMGPG